jgi:hypothetical protein
MDGRSGAGLFALCRAVKDVPAGTEIGFSYLTTRQYLEDQPLRPWGITMQRDPCLPRLQKLAKGVRPPRGADSHKALEFVRKAALKERCAAAGCALSILEAMQRSGFSQTECDPWRDFVLDTPCSAHEALAFIRHRAPPRKVKEMAVVVYGSELALDVVFDLFSKAQAPLPFIPGF